MNCKNCQTQLQENFDYCTSCGGKVIRNRLTFKNLFEHLSETFFNYDNKLLRTCLALITKPEDVIGGYINGVRKKYVNPISFFGLALTLSGLSIFILKKFHIEALDFSNIYGYTEASSQMQESIFSNILEYNSLIYALFIPLFALLSWVLFLNKKYNLTEHIVMYLYTMSLINIFSVVIGQLMLLLLPQFYFNYGIGIWLIMFLYHCYVLKRIFKLSVGNLILKSLLFLLLFFIVYIIISIIAGVLMFATGAMNIEDFKPK